MTLRVKGGERSFGGASGPLRDVFISMLSRIGRERIEGAHVRSAFEKTYLVSLSRAGTGSNFRNAQLPVAVGYRFWWMGSESFGWQGKNWGSGKKSSMVEE